MAFKNSVDTCSNIVANDSSHRVCVFREPLSHCPGGVDWGVILHEHPWTLLVCPLCREGRQEHPTKWMNILNALVVLKATWEKGPLLVT